MIKAITFDLWDTVIVDDSDEPKRKAAGRASKAQERRKLVKQFTEKYQEIPQEIIDAVYDAQDAAFRKVWHDHHVTWTVSERLDIILKGLGVAVPGNELSDLIRLHEEMEPAAVVKPMKPGPGTISKPPTRFGKAGGKYLQRPLIGKAKEYSKAIGKAIARVK